MTVVPIEGKAMLKASGKMRESAQKPEDDTSETRRYTSLRIRSTIA